MSARASPGEPDWLQLPEDLWRRALCSARSRAVPMEPSYASWEDCSEWNLWWRTLIRVGSTCRALRSALLGSDAGVLWQFVYLQSPMEASMDFFSSLSNG